MARVLHNHAIHIIIIHSTDGDTWIMQQELRLYLDGVRLSRTFRRQNPDLDLIRSGREDVDDSSVPAADRGAPPRSVRFTDRGVDPARLGVVLRG